MNISRFYFLIVYGLIHSMELRLNMNGFIPVFHPQFYLAKYLVVIEHE